MPSSARGESLVGVAEVIDGTSSIPADKWGKEVSLESRTRNLKSLGDLGPPDIVYIRKKFYPVVGGSKVFGYYHFVRGVNVDSAASVSAYLVDLVNTGLDAATWASTGSYEIVAATFRAFNALSQVDVVVDLKFPGGVSARGINATGEELELTDTLWAETALCAALRHVSSTGEHPLYPCLRVMDPSFETFESAMVEAAVACVPSWKGIGRADRSDVPTTVGTSRVAHALAAYFMSYCRFDRAIKFFSADAVSTTCSDTLIHIATAHRLQEDFENARICIDEAIRRTPKSAAAWIGRAKIHTAQNKMQDALEAANKACEFDSAGIAEFIALADICATLDKYQDAFIALNSSNIPQLELDYYLRDLVPLRGNKTSPVSGNAKGADATSVLAQRIKKEKNAFNSKCDEALNELPGKMMTQTEHDCYEILVKILNDVGWDKLLSFRGSAFVMETDVSQEAEKDEKKLSEANGTSDESVSENGDGNGSANGNAEPKPNGVEKSGDVLLDDKKEEGETKTNGNGADVGEDGGDTPKLEGVIPANEVPGLNVDDAVPESPLPDGLTDVPITPSVNSRKNVKEVQHVSRGAGKVVCKPWLDYLVTVMYEDLRAIAVWNAEERTFPPPSNGPSSSKKWSTPTASEHDKSKLTGSSSSSAATTPKLTKQSSRRAPEDVASTTKRPAPDWLRRGELAIRLQKKEEAKSAFWTCIKLSEKVKTPAISARLNLMDLAANDGDAVTTIMCADNVWSFVQTSCEKKSSSNSSSSSSSGNIAKPVSAPRVVQRAIFNLVSKLGLKNVRAALEKTEDIDRSRIGSLLLDAVSWKVHGYAS